MDRYPPYEDPMYNFHVMRMDKQTNRADYNTPVRPN